METTENESKGSSEFARQASGKRSSFLSDYLYLVRTNRKWWMLPLIGLLLVFSLLMVFATTGVAPFLYTLF